jgi:hypothetical protein
LQLHVAGLSYFNQQHDPMLEAQLLSIISVFQLILMVFILSGMGFGRVV